MDSARHGARPASNAKAAGLTFHDLRGTAVLRLALAGCTVPEIATITGHSIRDVQSILDSNYFHRDVALAESGIRKLEKRHAELNSGS
jgi:integrase